MACIKDYDVGSRRYNVISEYLELNNKISNKSRYVFDLMFEFILSELELKFTPKPHSKLFNKLTQFMEAINECQPSEILNYIRVFGKDISVTYEDLIESIEEIPEVLLWSPVPALEKMFDDFYENGYGTTFMSEYFKDESKSKKLIKAGKQTEFDQPCLLSLFLHSDNINHSVLKYCSGDFNDKFAVTNPNKWIDIMVEFGYDKKMRGIDYEFRNYVTKFAKLTKFWDVYKSQNISNGFINNQFLMFGGNNENNDLFKIYEGNYDLVKEIPNPVFNDADACKLICDWNAFNKLSPHKQKCVKAYLTQNINYINNFIQRGAEKIYAKLNKAKNTTNYMGLLNKYIKQKSYYNTTKLNDINTIQQTLNTRMNNAKFNTISDAMEFIVHQYIPLLRNYKKSPIFNSYTNNVMNNSDVLSVIGVADYINDEEPLTEVVTRYRTEVKYVDRPVTQYKTDVKYVDRPVVMRGGDDNRPQQNSTEKYINELIAFQKDFNTRYCDQWRSIVNKLRNLTGETISKDSNMNINVLSLIRKVLIYNTKTTSYISGLFTTKNINKQYMSVVENLISTIESTKISSLEQIVENLKQIVNLCSTSSKKAKELKSKYISSGSTLIDQFNISRGKLKIDNNLTLDEIKTMDDTLKRIERNIIENRAHNIQATSSANLLKDYINKRADKNKIIDNYFDSFENNMRYNLESDLNTMNDRDLYLEGQAIVGMRLLINREMKKSYKWLNSVYDVMLSKNRLEQMKNKVLSESILHKIEKAYLDFNSYDRTSELDELLRKFSRYTEDPNKFRSFFKIAKLAKKCIENVNLLGYVERLYKELDIINPEFNWNMFKENMISFLVTNMIRVDVFVLRDYKEKDKYNLVNFPKNLDYNAGDAVYYTENARQTPDLATHYGKTQYNTILNCGDLAATYTDNKNLFVDSEGEKNRKYFNKRKEWLKLNFNNIQYDQPLHISNLYQKVGENKYYMNFYELLYTKPSDKIMTYGFSLRKNLTDYYPNIKDIPTATIQSIYTPIVEILNKYIEQRNEQRPSLKDATITKLMYGGDKISAGSIFDIIDPKPFNNDVVNPDAVEYYISAYYIIRYYFKIIDYLNDTKNQEASDNNKDTFTAKLKFFKISPLYDLDKIFKNDSNTITSIKPLISILNDYWDSIEESNPKNKITKVIDSLISEINASFLYGSPDEINSFNESILSGEVDFYAFNFDKLNNTIAVTLKKAKEYLVTFAPGSMNNLSSYFNKYTSIIKEASPNERLSILENLLLRNDTIEFDEYNTFCELCITPFIIVINYYLNLLRNTYNVLTSGSLTESSIEEVQRFVKQYIKSNKEKKTTDSMNTFDLMTNPNDLNSFMVTFYDFVLNNSGRFDKNSIKQFFSYLFDSFTKDLNKVILLRMNYPGYSDVDIAEIKNGVLKYYETEIENAKSKFEKELTSEKLKDIETKFNQKNNLIPQLEYAFEKNILSKRLMDPKYPFIPSVIDMKDYGYFKVDNSFTKFVTIMLATQHPDYYLPQTYVTLLESSPLYGTTCSDIGTSVFTPDMVRSPTKFKENNQLNIMKDFGTTPLTNICLYLSKSETAINKTTTNLMNSYYATNLISVIPNILKLLYQCSKLFDDKFYYEPTLRGQNIFMDARMEISVLSQILVKLYNEVLPISNNIQFMDYLNTNVSHSFTELIDNFSRSQITFQDKKPLNYIEWINPIINTNVGINYDNYNRFEKYNNTFLKPLNDDNFAKIHDEVKELIAKIIGNSLMLSMKFVDLNPKIINNKPLMGGDQTYGSIKSSKMYGGDNDSFIKTIIENISKNPRVLALAGIYGFDENMIKHLFAKLYSKENPFNDAFKGTEFSIPMYATNGADKNGVTYNPITTPENITTPQTTSLSAELIRNTSNVEYINDIYKYLSEITNGMYGVDLKKYIENITNDDDSIDALSKKYLDKSYLMNKPLFDLAFIHSLNITLDYLEVIHLLDINKTNIRSLDKIKLSPIVKRMFIPNDITGNVNISNFTPDFYGDYTKYDADLSADEKKDLANVLYNKPESDLFANPAAITKEAIIKSNSKLSYEHYEKILQGLENDPKYRLKRAYINYLVTVSWNNVSLKFLSNEFKKGYDIYYHLFINTIIIASHIWKNDGLYTTSLNTVYKTYFQGSNLIISNLESYIASLLSRWSVIELSKKDKRISGYYASECVKTKVSPNPNIQLTFMKASTKQKGNNNMNYANKLFGEGNNKPLTDIFIDKYLELFMTKIKNGDKALISLGLLNHNTEKQIISHYNIGPFLTSTCGTNLSGSDYLDFETGSPNLDTEKVLKQTIRKCASSLMNNILFPDLEVSVGANKIYARQGNTKINMFKFDTTAGLLAGSYFEVNGVENYLNVVAYKTGQLLHYVAHPTVAKGAQLNVDINGNDGVAADPGNADFAEKNTKTMNEYFDVGGFINAAFLGSSETTRFVTIAKSLYLYNKISNDVKSIINDWNLIDEYFKLKDIALAANPKHTIKGVFDNARDLDIPKEYVNTIASTNKQPNAATALTNEMFIVPRQAILKSSNNLVRGGFGISVFAIGSHRRLLYEIGTLTDEPFTDGNEKQLLKQRLYMTTFTEENIKYLCVVVGRRIDILYEYLNISQFKLLSNKHPNIILGHTTAEKGIEDFDTHPDQYPFVTCTSCILIADYDSKPYLVNPYSDRKVGDQFMHNEREEAAITISTRIGDDDVFGEDNMLKIDINKENTLPIIKVDTEGMLKEIQKISTTDQLIVENESYSTIDKISLLFNTCLFGAPLKPSKEILDKFKKLKPSLDDCVKSGLLLSKTYPFNNNTAVDNIIRPYFTYLIIMDELNPAHIMNLVSINKSGSIKNIVEQLPTNDDIGSDTSKLNVDVNTNNTINTIELVTAAFSFLTEIDGLHYNMAYVVPESQDQTVSNLGYNIHVLNITDIPKNMPVGHGLVLGGDTRTLLTLTGNPDAPNANNSLALKKTIENLQQIFNNAGYPEVIKSKVIVYPTPSTYVGIMSYLNGKEIETQFYKETNLEEIRNILLMGNTGMFKSEGMRQRRIEYHSKITNSNINMFGGALPDEKVSYNLVADNQSYVEYNLSSLVKKYYYNGSDRLFEYMMPSRYTKNDLEKMIISYYNKSLLTFSPLFNKYLFVEIIYNSNVLKRFVIDSLNSFRQTSGEIGNSETLNYLYDMFTVFTQEGKLNSGMDIKGDTAGGEYKKSYLISTMVNPDVSIYNYIDKSPSSIARALVKYRNIILPVLENTDFSKNDRGDDELIKKSDAAKNQKGYVDTLMTVVSELMDIDKFNLFIGTLASLVKSIKFYNPRESTFVSYTDGKSMGPLSMAEVV